jgi:hypothetical protein
VLGLVQPGEQRAGLVGEDRAAPFRAVDQCDQPRHRDPVKLLGIERDIALAAREDRPGETQRLGLALQREQRAHEPGDLESL